jgi:cell wall assembly regulator SMI1
MENLMKQYIKLYGQPDRIIDVNEVISFQLAVFDPNEEDDIPDTTITSIGLSPHATNRFELEINILGKPSEKTMAEIGPFLYRLFEKLKNETVTEGNICTGIPVPSFGQMDAQWIAVANNSDYLSGPDGIGQVVRVFPLFKEEAEALEQASPHLRLLVMKWYHSLYADPGRAAMDIFHLIMAGLWERVAGEYEKIGAMEAALLHERLKSVKKSDFTKLEAELDMNIPPDFKASFDFHQNMEIEECRMYSQEEMLDLWRRMKELNDSGQFDPARDKIPDDERMQHVWWHEKWVPIAVDVWNNDYVVIDMDPGPKGLVGQILIWNRFEGAFYRFDSFYEWIDFLDFGLARGIYTFHEDGKQKNPDGGGGMYP